MFTKNKTIIIGIVIILSVIFTPMAKAQTSEQLNQQLISTLQQLIILLTEQLNQLITQLNEMKTNTGGVPQEITAPQIDKSARMEELKNQIIEKINYKEEKQKEYDIISKENKDYCENIRSQKLIKMKYKYNGSTMVVGSQEFKEFYETLHPNSRNPVDNEYGNCLSDKLENTKEKELSEEVDRTDNEINLVLFHEYKQLCLPGNAFMDKEGISCE